MLSRVKRCHVVSYFINNLDSMGRSHYYFVSAVVDHWDDNDSDNVSVFCPLCLRLYIYTKSLETYI